MTDQNRIILCPQCGGKMRLPIREATLNVTCPRCVHAFAVNNAGEITEPVTQPYAASPEAPESNNNQDMRRLITRGPVALLLALCSFYYLQPYSESQFWLLVGAHTLIAVVLISVAVKIGEGGYFPSFGGVAFDVALLFLILLGIAHIKSVGNVLISPAQTLLLQAAPTVIQWQNTLVDANASAPEASYAWVHTSDWLKDIYTKISYKLSNDSNWDTQPMNNQTLRDAIEMPRLSPRAGTHGVELVLTINNKSNVSVKSVSAITGVGNVSLGKVKYVASVPVLPGESKELMAKLPLPAGSQAVVWKSGYPQWAPGQLIFQVNHIETEHFNRQTYAERNLDQWLED